MDRKKVLVAGVSGLVGYAAARRFAREPGWDVVGVAPAHRPTSGQGRGRAAKEGRRRAVRWTCARST
jgi:NAD(P)-dependent dehydrogenase (short-subunit alcohol dehydrogenase family)